MREKTINEFNELLASSAPVPGGGGVSALVSALGAGLGVMVGRLTIGKKKYAEHEAELREISAESDGIRMRLLELVDEDARCFEPLSRAYSLPKDAPGRDEIMENCLMSATSAPMEVMHLSCRAIELTEHFARLGSALAISDAGCGAVLCASALKAAALNVYANTRLMKNREKAEEMNGKVREMLDKYVPIAEKTYRAVTERLGNAECGMRNNPVK